MEGSGPSRTSGSASTKDRWDVKHAIGLRKAEPRSARSQALSPFEAVVVKAEGR